jgi:hypothetical protein
MYQSNGGFINCPKGQFIHPGILWAGGFSNITNYNPGAEETVELRSVLDLVHHSQCDIDHPSEADQGAIHLWSR